MQHQHQHQHQAHSHNPASDLQLYGYNDLQAMGYGSRATVWRLRRRGEFPDPIIIGGLSKWTGAMLRELHDRR